MLLAKSGRRGLEGTSLIQHTKDVCESFKSLFGSKEFPTPLYHKWLKFFKIKEDIGFHDCVLTAAAFHDVGKANQPMQDVLRGYHSKQAIRHEHLSVLVLFNPSVKNWLNFTKINYSLLLSTVGCHHLKFEPSTFGIPFPEYTNDSFEFYSECKEFEQLLELIASYANLAVSDLPKIPSFWEFSEIAKLKTPLIKSLNILEGNGDVAKVVRATRCALIVSDAVGSAILKIGDLNEWVKKCFDKSLELSREKIEQYVINPRIEELGEEWKGWKDFQVGVDDLSDRSLLIAPCGGGKTLAAWRWMATRKRSFSRAIFLYPTQASATEGFRDYASPAAEEDAALLHDVANFDLEDMDFSPEDNRSINRYEIEEKLFALGVWRKRVISATVDQFLAVMQHKYSSICLLPLLADSVIVVDEVHSFDRGMLGALNDFLDNFDVPVLCMTGTLEQSRIDAMSKRLEVYSKPFDETPRYILEKTTQKEAIEKAKKVLATPNKKVLWVVNTVDKAQKLARYFSQFLPVICYHTRFMLKDKKKIHRQLINAFNRPGNVLAITTQVCEMSLDIDADVLITQKSPILSISQRMGRCRRKQRDALGQVFVYDDFKKDGTLDFRPYSLEALNEASKFVDALCDRPISLLDLQRAIEEYSKLPPKPNKFSSLIFSGPWATKVPFRDIEEYTAAALLDNKIDEYHNLKKEGKPWKGLIVQVLKDNLRTNSSLPPWLYVVPSSGYDSLIGYVV